MAKEEQKPVGPVIYSQQNLNGKIVELTREGETVRGTIMSNSGQFNNNELVFKWTNKHGTSCVSPLTGEEMEKLLGG